jgi:hypothetical protein
MMRVNLLLVVCGLALLLSACSFSGHKSKLHVVKPPAAGKAIQSSAGSQADAVPGQGQGGSKHIDAQGMIDISSKEPAVLPAGWPETLPVYPGATIKMAQQIGSGNTSALNVVLETKAAAQDALRFYDEKAKAAGFTNALQVNTKDGGGMYRYENEKQAFSVTAIAEAAGTTITLVLSQR